MRQPPRLSMLYRMAALLLLASLGTACSHDRYLFLQRADLAQLNARLLEQQDQLAALNTLNQQQLDRLDRQQHQLRQLIEQPSAAPPRRQPPTIQAEPPGRFQGKLVVGEVEPFYLLEPGLVYRARIDSGATTSSLHASRIQRFERDGEDWVRFDILDPQSNQPITLERPLSRHARIMQAGREEAERRAVVELPFMIGDQRQRAEFTLSDRSHLTYPVLIGRNVLRDLMLIDVGREHVTRLPDPLPRYTPSGDAP